MMYTKRPQRYSLSGTQISLPAFSKLHSMPWFSLIKSTTDTPWSFAMAQQESPG
jgi:hypothetical protein